jgi:hypothetical protein
MAYAFFSRIGRHLQASSQHVNSAILLLAPLPFLFFTSMIFAAFWQNDADYVFGRVRVVDAVLVDAGPPRASRGRPRFFPTFRLSDGQLLTLDNAMVADEIPPTNQTVVLRCSLGQSHHCKTPASPNIDPIFLAIAAIWSCLSVLMPIVMWRTLYKRLRASA